MKKTIDELRRVREIANRLNLGASPEARYLRAVVVELIGALVGDEEHHPDLEASGALYAAPEFVQARPARPPQAAPAAVAPTRPAPEPQRALTLAEAAAAAAARAKGGQSSPLGATATVAPPAAPPLAIVREPAPDPSVPDPAGPDFAANLAADLAAEDEEQEAQNTDGG